MKFNKVAQIILVATALMGLSQTVIAQEATPATSPCTVLSGPRGKIVPKDPMSQTRVTFSVRNCGEVKGIEPTSEEFAGVVFSDVTPTANRVTANVTADHTTLAVKRIGLRLVLSDGTRVETPKSVSLIAYSNEALRIRDETLNATTGTSKKVSTLSTEVEILKKDFLAHSEVLETLGSYMLARPNKSEVEDIVTQALERRKTPASTEARLEKIEKAFEALKVAQVVTSENLEYLSQTEVKKPGGRLGLGRSEQISYVAVKKERDNRKVLLALLDELQRDKASRPVLASLKPEEEKQ